MWRDSSYLRLQNASLLSLIGGCAPKLLIALRSYLAEYLINNLCYLKYFSRNCFYVSYKSVLPKTNKFSGLSHNLIQSFINRHQQTILLKFIFRWLNLHSQIVLPINSICKKILRMQLPAWCDGSNIERGFMSSKLNFFLLYIILYSTSYFE